MIKPLSNKTSETVAKAFDQLMEEFYTAYPQHKPATTAVVHTDSGNEFLGKQFQAMLQQRNMRHIEASGVHGSPIIERAHRSLKELARFAQISRESLQKLSYANVLTKHALPAYNQRKHSYFKNKFSPLTALAADTDTLASLVFKHHP